MADKEKDKEKKATEEDKKKDTPVKKKKLPKWAIIVIAIASALALFVVGVVIFINSRLNKINKIDNETLVTIAPEDEVFETDIVIDETSEQQNTMEPEDVVWADADINIMSDADVVNILFIGQDARPGEERARADSIIVCSINSRTNEITLVSLMRDMYVPIPGYSANRINAAYKFGGMELLDSVIEQDFGITIDGNVAVDFQSFIEAMSYVGNLDIELTAQEARYLNRNAENFANDAGYEPEEWNLTEGVNSLTPEQSLAYARIRHIGNSDYERTERQRLVLRAAFDKMNELPLPELLDFADEVLPCLYTDMTNSEMLGYIYTVVTNNISIGNDYRIPVDHSYSSECIQGMSVLVPNLSTNSEALQDYLTGDTPVA